MARPRRLDTKTGRVLLIRNIEWWMKNENLQKYTDLSSNPSRSVLTRVGVTRSVLTITRQSIVSYHCPCLSLPGTQGIQKYYEK